MIGLLRKPEDKIIRVGIVWIMMLTTIVSVENRWTKCEVCIFYGIPVLLSLGLVMLIWRRQKIHCTFTDIIAIAWFIYYVGRTWIGNEWFCQMEFMKTSELFLIYTSLRVAFDGTRMSAWILVGSIIAFGCYEACIGISQLCGYSSSRHNLYSITGNFLNPGPYSAYLMTGVVVGLVALKEFSCKNGIWKYLLVAAIVVMAVVLPATWSRSAYIGLSSVALIVYRDKYWKYRYVVWGCILLAGIVLYFIKQGSADGRLIIWRAALTTWTHYPWFGVGVGGFLHTFAEGMSQLTADGVDLFSVGVPDGAYNNLLKIVVEQGFIGGLFAVSATFSALIVLARNSKALIYGMVALLVFSLFSYPFDLLSYKVIAVLVVAWSESVGGKRLFEISRLKLLLSSCFLGFVSFQTGKISNECYKTDKDIYTGSFVYSSVEHYYNLMASENDNPFFLFEFGKMLREEGRYNDSNAILRKGTKCSADPMFYILMGNNYKCMAHYDLAEQAYRKAFAVMPNRLYPLYKLMLLYHDTGMRDRELEMARRVMEFKVKVKSPATEEMKEKAREIADTYPNHVNNVKNNMKD